MKKRLRCMGIPIGDIPFNRLAGGQLQEHIATIIECLVDGFHQLGMRSRPEDTTLKRIGI